MALTQADRPFLQRPAQPMCFITQLMMVIRPTRAAAAQPSSTQLAEGVSEQLGEAHAVPAWPTNSDWC